MNEQDVPLTFSDEDFERRYSSEETVSSTSGADPGPRPLIQQTAPAARLSRSPNKFMRTLLRRRLSASRQI